MLCDKCHKREAKIYCTEIINGVKKEQYLCETCAAEYTSFHLNDLDIKKELSVGMILSDFLEKSYEKQKKQDGVMLTCKTCGMKYSEFLEKGRFGCADCYHAFGKVFDKSLKQIQGSEMHHGKVPKGFVSPTEQAIKNISELDKLSLKLQYAIEKEEFEEAARLRDIIRDLKKEKQEKSQEEMNNA